MGKIKKTLSILLLIKTNEYITTHKKQKSTSKGGLLHERSSSRTAPSRGDGEAMLLTNRRPKTLAELSNSVVTPGVSGGDNQTLDYHVEDDNLPRARFVLLGPCARGQRRARGLDRVAAGPRGRRARGQRPHVLYLRSSPPEVPCRPDAGLHEQTPAQAVPPSEQRGRAVDRDGEDGGYPRERRSRGAPPAP